MGLAYIFIVGCALAFLCTVAVYALRNRQIAGSKAFLLQILCVIIWSVGSLMEMLSPTVQQMLLWRNIQQIGVFLVPVACVYFAIDYAQYVRMKKYLPLLLIVSVLAIVLIFTDASTHIMRTGYLVTSNRVFGKALSVQQTNIGKILVAYNYLLAFSSVVILFVFSRQVTKALRRQVLLNMLAIGLIFLLGFLKSAFLEGTDINIPIVTIFLPSSVILFYNLYKNNVFRVTPIAREKVFDVLEMGILVVDASGMLADINPYAQQLLSTCFGIEQQPNGKRMDDVFSGYESWLALSRGNAAGEIELRFDRGEERYIQIRVFPLQSSGGVYLGSVSIMSDLTIVRLQEFALRAKAETDSLTGLLNRESFLEVLSENLQISARSGALLSVLMMDLDKFKTINDTYGHIAGDRVLIAFSELLKTTLRHEDAIARIGGDEFVALLPGTSQREAAEIANRILRAAQSASVLMESNTSIPLTVSIGICDNAQAKMQENILQCADQAMYRAKNEPGNCFIAWDA